jgi:hypothetical protein
MKKPTKPRIALALGLLLIIPISAFVLGEPTPDFQQKELASFDPVLISEIPSNHKDIGHFKASLDVRLPFTDIQQIEFYGMEIRLEGNPDLDKIRVGVTNNLVSRIEVWKDENLIKTKELGFMSKMTFGAEQVMQVSFYDQSNMRYPDKAKLMMRFYSGTGFLGDIGTISLDLEPYGDLTGAKSIQPFSTTLQTYNLPEYSNFKIWKDYNALD